MDHVALLGYSSLLGFALYKIKDTLSRPVDLAANIMLLLGLVALISYHAKHLQTGRDIQDDEEQKKMRLVAHATLTAFLLMTLSSMSVAVFQFYDWFALFGHISLFVSVWGGFTQLFGLIMLTFYFAFASAQKIGKGSMEVLQLVGRVLLLGFFAVASGKGLVTM